MEWISLPFIPNGTSSRQTTLLVRPEYKTLFELVLKHYQYHVRRQVPSGCVIIGNPGIGKSVGCLNYFLVRAAMCGIPVVLQLDGRARSVFFSHDGAPVFFPHRAEHPALMRVETMLLVDPAAMSNSREPGACHAFTMVFAPPDDCHYEQLLKRVGMVHHLPAWTLEALEAARRILKPMSYVCYKTGQREELSAAKLRECVLPVFFSSFLAWAPTLFFFSTLTFFVFRFFFYF